MSIRQHSGPVALARRTPIVTACAWLLAGLCLVVQDASAAEDYATWDSFNNSSKVSAELWTGLDRSRIVKGGVAQFVQRDMGDQYTNTGTFNSSWGLDMRNPTAVTQMRASVTVTEYMLSGCPSNASPSVLQARLNAAFFNAGPGAATSRINDVGAVIRIRRLSTSNAPASTLEVQGVVYQCTTSDCNYGSVSLGAVDLGTVSLNTAVTLRMEWDQAAKRFNFYRDSNPVQRVSYVVDDSQPAYAPFRSIGTRTEMANCFSEARTEGLIAATFDGVNVNASAAP